jgi:REP element-mobilizing transposase RayT
MVTHLPRPKLSGREPVLVTMKVRSEIWSLRSRRAFARVLRSLTVAKIRLGVRIVHYSVQKDHAHLVVEPIDEVCLSRAMQGLAVRIAKAINKLMDRCGKVLRVARMKAFPPHGASI